MKKTPKQIKDLLLKIQSQDDLILVGGHAVNLWASTYQDRIPELEQYLPFSSEDLDFVGGKIDAVQVQQILGGELTLNKDFNPSPNTGVLITNNGNQSMRIDFLSSVFGLGDDEVANSAIVFQGRNELLELKLKVLNPLLCLQGKLKSYTGLPQAGRQDKKHLKISLLIAREYIKDICLERKPRDGFRLIETMFRTAKSDAGLKVWTQDGIDLLETIPTDTVQDLPDPAWDKFRQIRLPQAIQEISARREKYRLIEEQLNSRREAINAKKENTAFSKYLNPSDGERKAPSDNPSQER